MAWVFLDVETFLITPGKLAPKLVCVQMAQDGGEVHIHLATEPETFDAVRSALDCAWIIGHNIAFDLAVLGTAYPALMPAIWRAYDEGRVGDTMIAAQMLDISGGKLRAVRGAYSLAALYKRVTGNEIKKGDDSWQLRFGELYGKPLPEWPDEALRYATHDILATRVVWRAYGTSAVRDGDVDLAPTYAVQVRAAWALHLASCWGMRCDPHAVAQLRAKLDQTQNDLRARLTDAGLLRADGTRDDAAVRTYAEQVGASKRTPKGKISVTAAALQDVDDDLLRDLTAYLHAGKIRSTYLPVVEKGCAQPVQARYGLVGSGRTSCSSPNLQNLPRDGGIRECFAARPGRVFVAADYHVVELVCLAQVLGSWVVPHEVCEMGIALRRGMDLHVLTAAHILGISYDDAQARYRAGDKKVKETRQLAKGLNFGIPGGLGAEKLRQLLRGYGHDITVERAKTLKEQWLMLFPEMRLYFGKIANLVKTWPEGDAHVKHPTTGFVRGGLDYCSAANHMFQHLAAFGAKKALYAVQRACFSPTGPLAGSRMVAFVHDEIVLEVPEANCDAAARELVAIMCSEFLAATPDVPVHAEAVAMRSWCKNATPQYDSAGRLVPWSPR